MDESYTMPSIMMKQLVMVRNEVMERLILIDTGDYVDSNADESRRRRERVVCAEQRS